MGNIWILLAAPAAVLAAWLFLSVYGEQKQDLETSKLEQRRDRAEFDRDFQKAWDGKTNPKLEQRASDAAGQLAVAETERQRLEAARKIAHDQEAKELRDLLSSRVEGTSK